MQFSNFGWRVNLWKLIFDNDKKSHSKNLPFSASKRHCRHHNIGPFYPIPYKIFRENDTALKIPN